MSISRFRYVLIVWLFALSAVAYMARQIVTVSGPAMGPDFGMSTVQLGTVASFLFLGYAAFQIPGGWLAVQYGPRKVLCAGLVLWAALSVATNFIPLHMADALPVLVLLRCVLGAAEGVMYPCANQFIANWFPTNEHGMANGWVFAGVGVGSMLTPLIITRLLDLGGWQAGFWFIGILGLSSALIWYWLSRDRPEEHPKVSPAELAYIKSGRKNPDIAAGARTPWCRILTNRSVWGVSIAYFGFGYVAYIIITWFFIYMLKGRGVDMHKSAIYSVMPYLAMTLCCLVGGWFSDRLSSARGTYFGRCIFGAFSLILTAVFLVLGASVASTFWSATLLSCAAGGLYLGQSSYWAVTSNFAGSYTGVVSGMINMGCQIAGAITAQATPIIANRYGWGTAFNVAAGVALICSVAWFIVKPEQRLDTSDEQLTA